MDTPPANSHFDSKKVYRVFYEELTEGGTKELRHLVGHPEFTPHGLLVKRDGGRSDVLLAAWTKVEEVVEGRRDP